MSKPQCTFYFLTKNPYNRFLSLYFGIVVGFIGAGIAALIKGVRGNWDNKIRPEDIVGPGKKQNENSDDSDKD